MKKTLSVILAVLTVASAIAAAIPASAVRTGFSDVDGDRWSAASIRYAVDKGYMKGVGGDKFDPEGSLTRAMVATVLWRREGSPAPGAPSGFTDVAAGEWYADAVAWAKENGVVKGITEKTFEPDGEITREQLATMLFRFSSSAPVSVPERADLSPFSDDEKVSEWANEPLGWAVEAGLIKGTDGNRLAPEGSATREQFAAVIERFDGTFKLVYNEPVIRSHYTEKEYPLVDDADFYVAPDGNDDAEGSFDHPFATFRRAVLAVRELKKTKTDDITVAFKAGEYDPMIVELTEEDSGSSGQRITYCKYGDGDVTYTGGMVFDEDDFSKLDAAEAERFGKNAANIRKIHLDERITEGGFNIYGDEGILYPARYPNKYEDGTDHLLPAAATVSETQMKFTLAMAKRRFESYKDPAGIQIYGFLTYGWYKETLTIGLDDYDPETGIFTISDAANSYFARLSGAPGLRYVLNPDGTYNFVKEDVTFAFVNMPEDLDYRGEYLFDGDTGTLYVYDPRGEYVIPKETTLIRLTRADCITLRGFTFIGSNDASVRTWEASGFHLENCRFKVTSCNEFVVVEHAVEGKEFDFRLTDCDFESAPLMAVRVHPHREGKGRFNYPVNCYYDNNRFSKIGIGVDGGVALFIRDHDSAIISHNEFEDCARSAIMHSGCMHMRIEYNVFRRCMYNSDDGGVIYCGNDREEFDNIVRYNIFYPSMWYGDYVDDGGVGVEMYGNLFCEICAICVHDGRDNSFHDNALINCDVAITPAVYNDPDIEEHIKDVRWNDFYNSWLNYFNMLEEDPQYKAVIEKERPEVFDLILDPSKYMDPAFVLAPYNVVRDNVKVTAEPKEDWYTPNEKIKGFVVSEGNRSYPLTENPIFVNPTRGDYRIRDGVDFPDIHFEEIGRY